QLWGTTAWTNIVTSSPSITGAPGWNTITLSLLAGSGFETTTQLQIMAPAGVNAGGVWVDNVRLHQTCALNTGWVRDTSCCTVNTPTNTSSNTATKTA